MSDEVKLHDTIDAVVWAKEFKRLNPDADEDLMRAWFANAIMAGFDDGHRRAQYEEREACARTAEQRFARGFEGNGDWHDGGEEIAEAIRARTPAPIRADIEKLRADIEQHVVDILHSDRRE